MLAIPVWGADTVKLGALDVVKRSKGEMQPRLGGTKGVPVIEYRGGIVGRLV